VSERWEARFEIVSGPFDGLTFVVADEGLSAEIDIHAVPAARELYLRDFADVGFAVDSEGARLDLAGAFALNGEQVSGAQVLRDGDVVRIGATEVLLVGHSRAEVSSEQAAGGEANEPESGGDDDLGASQRRCLRPGCGAMNPPGAKWCLVCGWDLEDPQENTPA
jgi:hypothetical protein